MPKQLIPVSHYSRDMIGNFYNSNGSGDVSGTSHLAFLIGYATNQVRILYANYQGGLGETVNGNAITVSCAIQTSPDSGTPLQLTFGGQTSISIAPGQQVYTDWFTPPTALTAGQFVTVRTYAQWPYPGQISTGPYSYPGQGAITGYYGIAGNNYVQNNSIAAKANGSNQLLTPGSCSAWYSSNNPNQYGPLVIEGYASDGVIRPIAGLVGDSIIQGSSDDQSMCGGAAVRAMVALKIPYYNVAKGGENLANVFSGAQFSQRLGRMRKCSVIIEQYGTNDFNALSATFATLKAQKLLFWQLLSVEGAPIIPVTLLPRPSFAGSIYPVSNQTVNPNLAAYQAYNAWLRGPVYAGAGNSAIYDAAQLGINIPTICDVASYIETNASNATPGGPAAPLNGGYWWCGAGNNTAYSGDGAHPNTPGAIYMQQAFMAMQQYITASTPAFIPTSSTLQPISTGAAYNVTSGINVQTSTGVITIAPNQSIIAARSETSD